MITKEEWRNGEFRKYPEFKTQDGYYNAVSEFVKAYGEPTKEDMLVARSGNYREFIKGNFGCSWNPNLNITRKVAKLYFSDTIYVMFVPKGTMAVHYEQGEGNGWCGLEEEYVFDMKGLGLNKRGKAHIIAKHNGDWDYHSDIETDKDFEQWELIRQPFMFTNTSITEDVRERFFAQ